MSLSSVSLFAAALPEKPEIGDAFSFLLAGFSVVMATLLVLAFVCALVGWLFKKFPALGGPPPEPPARKKTAVSAFAGVDERVVAVVGAAVDQALGGRFRIKSISPVSKK